MAFTEADIPNLTGRNAVVTGATGGLGFEIARALSGAGAAVIVAGRDDAKGAAAIAALQAAHPRGRVRYEQVDLADLASVQAFAGRRISEGVALDLLVNNAGLMAPPTRQTTADGFERQFGVNHLGHFALTGRLLPLLVKAAAPRVVTMSSGIAAAGKMAFDDLQSEQAYRPTAAYNQSKLANLLFMRELARRSEAGGWNLVSVAAHPGHARTQLIANGVGRPDPLTAILIKGLQAVASHAAAAGALSALRAATGADVCAGDYYGPGGFLQQKGPPTRIQLPANALNDAAADRLWVVSERLTGVRYVHGT